jgi:hypothetical protein
MDSGLTYELQLARNLATAFIATEIGLDYARKKYAEQPIGEFWISLARMVIEQLGNRGTPARLTPPTIQ